MRRSDDLLPYLDRTQINSLRRPTPSPPASPSPSPPRAFQSPVHEAVPSSEGGRPVLRGSTRDAQSTMSLRLHIGPAAIRPIGLGKSDRFE
jgi:hypothetical protein